MPKAKKGDTVQIHYNGFLQNGEIFESTTTRDPFEFTLGQSDVIPDIADAVIGMHEGDTKVVKVSPADAYGFHDKRTGAVKELAFEIHLLKISQA